MNENGNEWWSPKSPGGSWPNRPSGLWKLKKLRRGCDAAAATPPPPPNSSSSLKQLKPSSSSSSSDNYYYNDDDDDDDAQAKAALAGREDGEFYAKVPNHGG